MDPAFNKIQDSPWNQVFKVVFYPDRIYHAQYLNATRSPRYRYNVLEVRGRADFQILKAEVYLDAKYIGNLLRIEYRAGRLAEQVRERGRFLRGEAMAWLRIRHADPTKIAEAFVKLFYDEYVDAYQVELWESLEPPPTGSHDFKVLDQMGWLKPITTLRELKPALRELRGIRGIEIAFRETDRDLPFNYKIADASWDNDYTRSHQEPRNPAPNSGENTVQDNNYFVTFQRGWLLRAQDTAPVRYENAMMDPDNPDRKPGNFVDMRWIIQRELGGTIVYFHEVTLQPGAVEGTHRHLGSEELYFFTEGEGVAHIGEGDDPEADARYPTVPRNVYGFGVKPVKEVPVQAGHVIFTKSGGIHGISNPGQKPLRFVAFGYHTS
jgi:mannose-6-phosphate isomerase-like protein (cupin superfamily)